MKRILYFCLFVVVLTGCATQRWCNKHYPPVVDSVYIVTRHDSIVYKDTIVYVKLPGKEIHDSVVIPCPAPPPEYIPDTAKAETDFAIAKAWWSYPVISLFLKQKTGILEFKLDSAVKEKYYWKNEYLKIREVKETKYVPKIYKQALYVCIFIIVGGIFWLAWKIFRK